LFNLFLLLIYSAFVGNGTGITWLALPLLIFVQFLLVFSSACLVAAITPFLPDLKVIFDKLMTLLFFLSGIFYTADVIPESIRGYFRFNPAFSLIESYRDILVYHRWPSLSAIVTISIFSLVILTVACYILRRFDRIYPRLIY